MSIRTTNIRSELDPTLASMEASSEELSLSEGNSFCVASPENPLNRNLVVSIKASLNSLCLQRSKGIWAPSTESLKATFQQRKFTSLDGEADSQGDLKSVVLHDLHATQVVSTFPISLGAKITGVDDITFTSTGQPFSMVVPPNSNAAIQSKLQSDDVSLAYDFAKKFPGYTADNLGEKGIHEVSARKFVLVSADHPLVSAISENADKLQMGEISVMPEGLVKISQSLYDNVLPLVKQQVASQIKVRDFSSASVSIIPAEFPSWSAARADLVTEAKRPLKAQMELELSSAASEEEMKTIRASFAQKEATVENDIDHKPMEFHLSLGVKYNFLSK